MTSCCEEKSCELTALRNRHAGVLKIVLVINAVMFAVEAGVGWWAGSAALVADSLDMLGDALVYGFSLYVLHRATEVRARAALLKGLVQLAFGLAALWQVARVLLGDAVPSAGAMGWMGAIALAANLACFTLLTRHRADDLNMRSVWLCSRNDLFANSGVLVAAALVAVTGTVWPDVVVGALIAALFLHTSGQVIREALREMDPKLA